MPYHPFFERIVELADSIGNFIVPIAGGLISFFEMRDAWREKRIRDFNNAGEFSPEDRGEYAENCLEIYRQQYAQEIERGEVVVRDLIYPRVWLQRPDQDDFMLLKDVKVEISDTKWDKHPPTTWFLPYPWDGYVSNKKTVQAGKSLMFNGRLFALEGMHGDASRGDLAVTVKTGGYFDFLNTCEYLVHEMAHARRVRRKRPPKRL
ncbi:MAG: hypothetical protein IKU27_04545, partial [Clostridia bacterium]|nr:hypothetical protein [Clostridia bacterium]